MNSKTVNDYIGTFPEVVNRETITTTLATAYIKFWDESEDEKPCLSDTMDLWLEDDEDSKNIFNFHVTAGEDFTNLVRNIRSQIAVSRPDVVESEMWEPQPDAYYIGVLPPKLTKKKLVKIMGEAYIKFWHDVEEHTENAEWTTEDLNLGETLDAWFEHAARPKESEQESFDHLVPEEEFEQFCEDVTAYIEEKDPSILYAANRSEAESDEESEEEKSDPTFRVPGATYVTRGDKLVFDFTISHPGAGSCRDFDSNLDNLSKVELKQVATFLRIKFTSDTKKADLLEKIKVKSC